MSLKSSSLSWMKCLEPEIEVYIGSKTTAGMWSSKIHTCTYTQAHRAETRAAQFWICIWAITLSPPAAAGYGAVPAAVWFQQSFSRHRLHLLSKELCDEFLGRFQCHLSSPAAPWQIWAKHQIPTTGTTRAVSIIQAGSRPGTPSADRNTLSFAA